MLYRKKPIEVEAWQIGSCEKWSWWLKEAIRNKTVCIPVDEGDWLIKTREGDHYASYGDYIIRGINGELYPCKQDIFEHTYEVIEHV